MPQGLIPREKIKPSPITAFLFYFSLIVLMGSVAVTVWLQFKVNPLKKKFEENKILISKIKTQEDEVIEKEMLFPVISFCLKIQPIHKFSLII